MSFFMEYLKNPSKIGAIAPSSKWLAKKMVGQIRFKECRCIVEYGPGTGVFTDEVIRRKKNITFIVIEQNREFYLRLKKKYSKIKNLVLINGDASNIEKYLADRGIDKVDYIISGLPFASLPSKVSHNILKATQRVIGRKGKFITFQYTLLKKKFFLNYFNIDKITFEIKNLPPAFVLTMKNK